LKVILNSLGRVTSLLLGSPVVELLDGPGFESRWLRDFPHLSRPALKLIQPPVQWVRCLSRG